MQAVRDAAGALAVRGPHRRGQAVLAAVGEAHRVVLGLERRDGHHRPEDLLLARARVVRQPCISISQVRGQVRGAGVQSASAHQ